MEAVSVDSCFLIDIEKETAHSKLGPAVKLLKDLSSTKLFISPTALGEFAVGFENESHSVLQLVISSFEILRSSQSVSFEYARLYRSMKSQLIGANDLWIAAYSIVERLPLITNNVREFRRVRGLEVVSY